MNASAVVVGVHPVTAVEPVHLVELFVDGPIEEFDTDELTQEDTSQPCANWQVAYAEQVLAKSDVTLRLAFFFHYLDLEKPLRSSFGPLSLPQPTVIPRHLQGIKYEAP